MQNRQLRSSLLLVLTAFIWGAAFVAQSVSMDYIGPFTFLAARFLIGGIVLIPVIIFMRKTSKNSTDTKTGIIGGICCGLCLCVAAALQQIGISFTTVGKAGFITALYIIIVPLLGIFMRKKVPLHVWVSVAVAVIGMYLLCITEEFTIGKGDFFVFLCALAFSVHILVIDYFSPKADGVLISCIQFFTAGIIAAIVMIFTEKPQWSNVMQAGIPILYAGVMSSGVGYTLQVVAQKNIDPTIASLLMSLESVFSLLSGWVILGEVLLPKERIGCALVFGAIVLAQIPMPKPHTKAKR